MVEIRLRYYCTAFVKVTSSLSDTSSCHTLGLLRVGDIAVKLKRLKISLIIFLECSYPGACFSPVLGIIAVMTPLAQSTKILWVTILWLMIEVCHRQNDICKFPSLLIPTVRMILYTTELTAVFCSLQYGCSYLFPVGRITALVLWSYWHFLLYIKIKMANLPPALVFGVLP